MSTTIWGSFDGALTQYIRPYIEVSWTQDIPNNRSTVTANLYFHRYTNNYWSYNELTNSNGHSSTFRVGNSTLTQIRPFNLQNENPPNRVLVWSRTQTISHNADGTGSVNISASGNTNVNPQYYSFGQVVTLPQIPRQTTINSASISGSLSPSTSQTVTVSVDRKHSSYKMDYAIYAGSTRIRNLTNQNVLTSISLTGAQVNSIINTMSSVTSRSLELRVTTKDSNGNQIGTPESKNFNVSLNTSNTRPSFTQASRGISGNGHDNDIGVYVQNISRVYAYFDVNWGYGASGTSRSITINGQSFGSQVSGNPQRFSGTSPVLTKTGQVDVIFSATNSRGQTYSETQTVSVSAYSPPRIVNFNGARSDTTPTTVPLNRSASWHNLGGQNAVSSAIERKQSSSTSWTTVHSGTSSTGSINTNYVSTGNAETIAYDFRWTITDQFGNHATSVVTVPSAKVLMHMLRDDSIGIGRYSQNKAELEVGGGAIIDGRLLLGGTEADNALSMGQYSSGAAYIHASEGRSLFLNANDVFMTTKDANSDALIDSDVDGNSGYIKFYDGTMLCWGESDSRTTTSAFGALYRSNSIWVDFPQTFISPPKVTTETGGLETWGTTNDVQNHRFSTFTIGPIQSSTTTVNYIAIGRWK